MARTGVISRLATALLAMIGALIVVLGLLIWFGPERLQLRIAQSSFAAHDAGGVVIASPVHLGDRPGLILLGGTVSTTTTGQPARPALLLTRPVFRFDPGTGSPLADAVSTPAAADLGAALAPALGRFAEHGFKTMVIRNGEIRIGGPHPAGGPEIVLADVTAEIDSAAAGQFAGRGGFTMRGQRFEFSGRIEAPKDARQSALRPLRFALKSPVFDATFDGRLDTSDALRIIGQAEGQMPRAARTLLWLGLDAADSDQLAAIAFKGQLEWAGSTLALRNARISVDGSDATGGLLLGWSGAKPSIDGTLAFGDLAIERYLGLAGAENPAAALGSAPWRALDATLPFVNAIDGDVRLSAADVRLAGLSLGRLAATVTAKGGVLTIDVAELQSAAAATQVTLRVDQSGPAPRYGLRAKCDQNSGSFLADRLFGRSLVSGPARTAFDLAGSGATMAEVLSSVAGTLSVSMRPGGRINADLAALARGGDGADPGWAGLPAAQTKLDALELKGRIARGMVLLDKLNIVSPGQQLTGRGQIDLAGRTLDVQLEGMTAGRWAQTSAALGEPRKPASATLITLAGPWASPVIRTRVPGDPAPTLPQERVPRGP